MNKLLLSLNEAGSKKHDEPRLIGEVLRDFLRSDEPLAEAFRKRLAEKVGGDDAQEGPDGEPLLELYPDTFLDVNLKVEKRMKGRMKIGELLAGVLSRDGYDHLTFVQNAKTNGKTQKRKAHLYRGTHVNVLVGHDCFVLSFKHPMLSTTRQLGDFCREAADELYVVAGLIERKDGLDNR